MSRYSTATTGHEKKDMDTFVHLHTHNDQIIQKHNLGETPLAWSDFIRRINCISD